MPGTPFSQFPGTVEQFLGMGAPAQRVGPSTQETLVPQPRQQPAPRQQPRRRRPRRRQPKPNVAQMFFNKLQSGAASAGPSMIPFSVLPEQFRREVQLDEPPVGWDPRQLTKKERMFAANLVQRSDTVDEDRRSMMIASLVQAQQEEDAKKGSRK